MRHLKQIQYSVWMLAILAVAGCSALGLQPAQSFQDKLAYGYATHKAVIDTATNAVTLGTLSVEDAEAVHKLGVESKTLLDAARIVYTAGDPTAANSKLLLATAVLNELQRYLSARGVQ